MMMRDNGLLLGTLYMQHKDISTDSLEAI